MADIYMTLRGDIGIETLKMEINELLQLNINHFRFNFSKYYNDEKRIKVSEVIREMKNISRDISIMLDFPYPKKKARIDMGANTIKISKDNIYYLCGKENCMEEYGNNVILLDSLVGKWNEGDIVYYGDGECCFVIQQVLKDFLVVKALVSYDMYSGKPLSVGTIQADDSYLENMRQVIDIVKPNSVALSFVSSGNEIDLIRSKFEKVTFDIISKIESKEAMDNLTEIVDKSDAIMVARGDLGLYSGIESLAIYQAQIIKQTQKENKKVYVATGILMSLINNYVPSRPDIIDVTELLTKKVDALILNNDIIYYEKAKQATDIIRKITQLV